MEKEFIKIIGENQGIILKICRMYSRQKDDSEDLFQEILLNLWKSYPAFQGNSKVTTWMYRIGLNVAITGFKKKTKRGENLQISYEHENISESNSQRIDLEYDKELQKAIDQLNKFDKAIVMLYLEEKSYNEMAEIIGISETNLGVKINRIKKKLKEILNP